MCVCVCACVVCSYIHLYTYILCTFQGINISFTKKKILLINLKFQLDLKIINKANVHLILYYSNSFTELFPDLCLIKLIDFSETVLLCLYGSTNLVSRVLLVLLRRTQSFLSATSLVFTSVTFVALPSLKLARVLPFVS